MLDPFDEAMDSCWSDELDCIARPDPEPVVDPGAPPVLNSVALRGEGSPSLKWNGLTPEEVARLPEPDAEFRWTHASTIPVSKKLIWLWHGMIALAHVTLLVGAYKNGKTTLLCTVIRHMSTGGTLGTKITPCTVLVITEEDESLWRERHIESPLPDNVGILSRPFIAQPNENDWESFCKEIAVWVKRDGIDLVVMDPWLDLSPAISENDATAVKNALLPIRNITSENAAVLLFHHPRKAPSFQGAPSNLAVPSLLDSARGSTALAGSIDFCVSLTPYAPNATADTRRNLHIIGRAVKPPIDHMILNYDPVTMLYSSLAVGEKSIKKQRSDTILKILSDAPLGKDGTHGMTSPEISAAWPPGGLRCGDRKLRLILAVLVAQKKVDRSGIGRASHPFKWAITEQPSGDEDDAPKEDAQ